MMVSGSPVGHIAVWNLEERKLQTQIRSAHTGAVSGLKCLASQPIMVTSGVDNALKVCRHFTFIYVLIVHQIN